MLGSVKNWWLFLASAVLAVVAAGFAIDRMAFLAGAERTAGEVTSLSAKNTRCGRRRSSHNCTKFWAEVRYAAGGQPRTLRVTAGSERGHDQPLSDARYAVGARVPIVYSPRPRGRAYRDELWDIWGAPLIAFFAQIGTLFGSFTERRRSA